MRRVIGMDIHRTFAEVVFWENGRLRWQSRVDMTRLGLEGFGRSLTKDDEVVVEATGNAMAVRAGGDPGGGAGGLAEARPGGRIEIVTRSGHRLIVGGR
jgi:hypothetical protein